MFPVRVDRVYDVSSGGGLLNNNAARDGNISERDKYSFFQCFVVFVRFWGVVTAIGECVINCQRK